MVSHCANPECSAPLRYLRDGRLFQFEVRALHAVPLSSTPGASARRKPPRQVSHFWLCGQCASNLTLMFDQQRGVVLMPLHPVPQAASPSATL